MKTKFVIFSQSRSGSTLLKQLIDSHPDVTCDGEIFTTSDGYLDSRFFCKVWRKLPYPFIYYHKHLASSVVFGFTLFIYHIPSIGRTINNLHRLGWKIIYLERTNIVNQAFSQIIAMETNNWHRWGDQKAINKTHNLSSEKFIKVVKNRINWHQREANILTSIPHFRINYEKNLENQVNWEESLSQIFNFLEIDPHPVQTNLKKMFSKPYSELIENYDELMEALRIHNLSDLLNKHYKEGH